MEEFMKQYAGSIFAGIVLISMLIFIFSGIQDGEGNRGILAVMAAHIDTEETDYATYNDYDSYAMESIKAFPVINYHDAGYFPVGTVPFLAQVEVLDYAGRNLPYAGGVVDDAEKSSGYFKIVKIEDHAGNDLNASVNMDTGEITFSQSGIYRITLRAQDDGCRKTMVTINIAVM